jgi:hypothetical protein
MAGQVHRSRKNKAGIVIAGPKKRTRIVSSDIRH